MKRTLDIDRYIPFESYLNYSKVTETDIQNALRFARIQGYTRVKGGSARLFMYNPHDLYAIRVARNIAGCIENQEEHYLTYESRRRFKTLIPSLELIGDETCFMRREGKCKYWEDFHMCSRMQVTLNADVYLQQLQLPEKELIQDLRMTLHWLKSKNVYIRELKRLDNIHNHIVIDYGMRRFAHIPL